MCSCLRVHVAADVLSLSHVLVDVEKVFGGVFEAADYINHTVAEWQRQPAVTAPRNKLQFSKLLVLTDRWYPAAVMDKVLLPRDKETFQVIGDTFSSRPDSQEFLQGTNILSGS